MPSGASKPSFIPLRTGNPFAISAGLFVLVVCLFLPSLRNGFVNFDDDLYVYANAQVQQGFGEASVRWAFTSFAGGLWHPLTWLSIMLDCQAYGLRPAGHHLTSLLLHAANTVLLFLVFRRATSFPWRSAVIAALFALHPMHVESFAWAAERKDVLSTFFWMLTLLLYVCYAQNRIKADHCAGIANQRTLGRFRLSGCYLLSFFFFVCGLMSKPMLVSVPVILLLLDWWPLGRFRLPMPASLWRRLLAEKLPFLVAALLACVIAIQAQKASGAYRSASEAPILGRLSNAALSYVAYLGQMVWPLRLAVYYPFPAMSSFWPAIGAALLLATISILFLRCFRSRPWLALGWSWYLVSLLPVIGLIQLAGQSRADRYTYVPFIGIFTLLVWGACDLTRRCRHQTAMLAAITTGLLIFWSALSREQIGYWKDSETLFGHTLLVTRNNDVAHNNLGVALANRGQIEEARGHFQEALRLNASYAQARVNLANALNFAGKTNEALEQYQAAVSSKPDSAEAQYFLAGALLRSGKTGEGLGRLRDAIRNNPDYAPALNDLAWLLATDRDPAIRDVSTAIRLGTRACQASAYQNPAYLDTLGTALSEAGRWQEAINVAEQAAALADHAGQNRLAEQIRKHLSVYQAGSAGTVQRQDHVQ